MHNISCILDKKLRKKKKRDKGNKEAIDLLF